MDLLEILQLRVEKALDKKKVEDGAINKVAAYASRETGDARKAVELLARAVKEAENTTGFLTVKEVDIAEYQLELDKTEQLIKALAKQQQLVLHACYTLLLKENQKITTGQAFEIYKRACSDGNFRPLTQRRFSDILSSLDLYGLINARVISMGRYGNTRQISSALPSEIINKFLKGNWSMHSNDNIFDF